MRSFLLFLATLLMVVAMLAAFSCAHYSIQLILFSSGNAPIEVGLLSLSAVVMIACGALSWLLFARNYARASNREQRESVSFALMLAGVAMIAMGFWVLPDSVLSTALITGGIITFAGGCMQRTVEFKEFVTGVF